MTLWYVGLNRYKMLYKALAKVFEFILILCENGGE